MAIFPIYGSSPDKLDKNIPGVPEQTPSLEDKIFQKQKELFEVLGVETKEEAKELDLNKLDPETIKKATEIKREIEGIIKTEKEQIKGTFKYDQRGDRGELERDSSDPGPVNIEDLELLGFVFEGQQKTIGEAIKNVNKELGQRTAEYLVEHRDEIPEEWQGKYLIFPGTEWRNSDGKRCVSYLVQHGGRWIIDFRWLDDRLLSNDRLVRPKK